MTSTKHPLIDLVMNDEVARYVGTLERRVILLSLDNLKLRTLLELLTDESWDDDAYPDDSQELRRIATDALVRRLGVSPEDAAATVAERWDRHNPPDSPEETKSYLIGPVRTKRVAAIPHAEAAGEPQATGYDVEKHLAGLKQAAINRNVQRDQV